MPRSSPGAFEEGRISRRRDGEAGVQAIAIAEDGSVTGTISTLPARSTTRSTRASMSVWSAPPTETRFRVGDRRPVRKLLDLGLIRFSILRKEVAHELRHPAP